MKGKLITFEGIDGSGKTTVASLLHEKIGKDAILTAEPTSSWLGECVRRALEEERDAVTIALLYLADRNEHVKEIIKYMEEGKIVICDRFIDSTFAYQKEHLKIENAEEWLNIVHKPFLIKPDLTFLLYIEPEKAIERIKERKLAIYEYVEFLRKVQENYMEIAQRDKNRVVILDATKSPEEIVEECIKILRERGII